MNTRPNLLFIMTDQLRHDCIGCAGQFNVSTPNIDRLARTGVRFDCAFSAIPTCCPARQALLRTKRPESFGAYWNYDITFPIATLQPNDYTWSRQLKNAGYKTAYVGKWHVNPTKSPLDFGYDDYYGVSDYGRYFESRRSYREFRNAWRGEADIVDVEDSRTHVLAREAIVKIQEFSRTGGPWHIRLDFPEPHLPSRPAGRFAAMYSAEQMKQWDSFPDTLQGKPFIQRQQLRNWGVESYTWDDWAPIVARYFGIISQIDEAIGSVLEAVADMGQDLNTIVVFTSDHGDLCGAHGMVDKHYVMYDDVVRVPLIISWPEHLKSTVVRESFVSATLDIGPTILDLLGMERPADTHGRSLRPELEGRTVAPVTEIIATYNGAQFGLYCQRMLRTKRWKYVWNLTDIDELYDLEKDPFELTNRVNDPNAAEELGRLRARLHSLLEDSGDPLCAGPWLTSQLTNRSPLETLDIPQTV